MSSFQPRSLDRSDHDEVVDLAPMVAVAARVADSIPAGSPDSWRRITFRAMLGAIIRDRVDNHTGDLEEGDVSSLDEFVEAAATAALKAPEVYRDDAYEVLLNALLEDWFDNWESTDDEDDDD